MDDTGQTLYRHVETLFPICRSITGDGLRQTLRYVGRHIPLQMHEVPSGTPVLDWTIPMEWNVRKASLHTSDGLEILNLTDTNLHILQYSTQFDGVVSLEELSSHLHSLPEKPDVVPYRTSYYTRTWGLCVAHRVKERLRDTDYRVSIDTSLAAGSLTYGEALLQGETQDEVLISAHCCHPSLANDNLSGVAIAIELARQLADRPRRFSYRFLFAPGTIGAIAWLHFNQDRVKNIRHGIVLTCLGDDGPPAYKQSRRGDALIDRYMAHVLTDEGHGDRLLPFDPIGYDERQFCSPGFDLPVGRFSRSPGGTFPEYHTSDDNLSFVKPAALADSLRLLRRVVDLIEDDRVWRNTAPYGEPQLGRRGLYAVESQQAHMAMMWLLNQADGSHSLLDIARRSKIPFEVLAVAAKRLQAAGLLEEQQA